MGGKGAEIGDLTLIKFRNLVSAIVVHILFDLDNLNEGVEKQ